MSRPSRIKVNTIFVGIPSRFTIDAILMSSGRNVVLVSDSDQPVPALRCALALQPVQAERLGRALIDAAKAARRMK